MEKPLIPKPGKQKTPVTPPIVTGLDFKVDAEKVQSLTAHEKKILGAYLSAMQGLAQLIYLKKEVPSGHLYAELCGALSLSSYTMMVEQLIKLKFITVSHHLIKWIGPDIVLPDGAATQVEEQVM